MELEQVWTVAKLAHRPAHEAKVVLCSAAKRQNGLAFDCTFQSQIPHAQNCMYKILGGLFVFLIL